MEESWSSSSATMLKLTAFNYSIWKPRIEDILYCKDLYEPLQLLGQKSEGKLDDIWSILNRKATTQNKASIIRRLVNLKYKDGRSVTEHLSNFQGLINQLTNMQMVLDDGLQALVLLNSLPNSWDTLVVSLSNSAPQGVLTLNIVKDSMFNEEAMRKEQGVIVESEALISEYRGITSNRKFHTGDKLKCRSRDGSIGRSKTRRDLECYHCGQINHMKRECRLFKREQDRGNENSNAKHTTATTSGGNEIVDFGASLHVTSRKDFFTSYTNGDFINVRMRNDKLSKIVGRRDVSFKTNTSCHLVLKDVKYVPDMRLNLISIGLHDDEGYINRLKETQVHLPSPENTIAVIHLELLGGWVARQECPQPVCGKAGVKSNSNKHDIKNSFVPARGKKENTLYITHAKVNNGYLNALTEDSIKL
ncbi:hypothetical protein Prudu_013229 [Prunus dulcis]|uniref:CCHC-type domain-containing protein n=1 Tax=Prunus dulcis TaxID=3755 RepID=A0A4Y1REW4_PRUDU|nr:hypothetical protein Prudu_013229 [Prunus dulcis]